MSGSLRSGSYSNAVLETLRDKFAGRADFRFTTSRRSRSTIRISKATSGRRAGQAMLAEIAEATGLSCAPPIQPQHPGGFENAIDWASRLLPVGLAYKPVAIMATSRGPLGGAGSSNT